MGYIFTDKKTRDKRESICNTCEKKDDVKCGMCGCFLLFLQKIQHSECPLHKW